MSEHRIPEQEGSLDASVSERVDGLIEQLRADVEEGHVHDARAELRERLDEMGITASDVEFELLVSRAESGWPSNERGPRGSGGR